MKFYMTPGSCSTGIHLLLEEVGAVFEVYIVNLPAGDHLKPDYLAINPRATIPTLVLDDGRPITDFQAIAWWLARQYPRRKLLPDDAAGEVCVLEWMDYAVGTIHGQGFTRIFTTSSYTPNTADHEAVQARGPEIVTRGFEVMNAQLEGRDFLAGRFSIADAALFYTEFWAEHLKMTLPPNCRAHYLRMLERPSVRQVLAEEGYRV